MHPVRSALILASSVGLLAACGPEEGSGFITSEDRQVASFTKVKVTDGLSAEIIIGPQRVTVTTDENLIGAFKLDVDGDTLKLERGGGAIEPTVASIVISTPFLEGLEVTDKSQVTAQATQSEDWRLIVTDRSSATVTGITAAKLFVDARDESSVEATGLARDIDLDCHQKSIVTTAGVNAGGAKLDVSGGSLVTVTATREVEIDMSGNSRVIVSGNPPLRDLDYDNGSEVIFTDQ